MDQFEKIEVEEGQLSFLDYFSELVDESAVKAHTAWDSGDNDATDRHATEWQRALDLKYAWDDAMHLPVTLTRSA